MASIEAIHARRILDSRSNPTLEVEVALDDGTVGRAAPRNEEYAERWRSSPQIEATWVFQPTSPQIEATWVFQPTSPQIEATWAFQPTSPEIEATWAFQPRIRLPERERHRIRWMAVLAVLVVPILGFVSYKFALGAGSAAVPSVMPSVQGRPTAAPSARPAAVQVLTPTNVTAVGPGGGDDRQQAALAISGNPATPWHTDWYATPYFGNLYAGTGLLLDMDRTITITSVRLSLGSARGAELQLRVGGSPVLADLHTVATSSGAGGTVTLSPTSAAHARYLLLWFTKLPPDNAGTYQASIYEITVKGQP